MLQSQWFSGISRRFGPSLAVTIRPGPWPSVVSVALPVLSFTQALLATCATTSGSGKIYHVL
jgi:hypothetical protein